MSLCSPTDAVAIQLSSREKAAAVKKTCLTRKLNGERAVFFLGAKNETGNIKLRVEKWESSGAEKCGNGGGGGEKEKVRIPRKRKANLNSLFSNFGVARRVRRLRPP